MTVGGFIPPLRKLKPEEDLTGKRFGRLEVIKLAFSDYNRHWLCKCDCGKEHIAITSALKDGNTNGCGCKQSQNNVQYNLIGKRFGKLVVIQTNHSAANRARLWLCQCDCGQTHLVRGNHLISGATKSCGCLRRKQTTH